MTWSKLISRELVDITSISQIDIVVVDYAWEFQKKNREVFFTIVKDKVLTHYIDVDKKEYWRYAFDKLFKSVDDAKKYFREGLVLIKKMKNIDVNKDLLTLFQEYREQFKLVNYNYSIGMWLAIEGWQTDFDEMVMRMIKKNHLEEKQEEIIHSLYKPWKKTALVEIQEKMNQGVKIKRLVKDYQFLRNWSAVWYRPITEEWFKNFTPLKEYAEKEYSLKEIKKLLKPNRKEEHYIDLAPYIIFLKDWRDDLRRLQCYVWSFMFERIAKKYGLELFDLGYLTLDEIEEGIKKKHFDRRIIEFRKNNPVIITILGKELKIKVLDENIPQKYFDIIAEAENESAREEVKGLTAQPGFVKGKVIIIKTYHDIKRIKEGDVLIANTTHPNYAPGMRKAAAFITNEGGLICHAAIVSRELKKPCIVGTKIATKVFKDGDLVEVDADKGIIKKVNAEKGVVRIIKK